MRARAERRGPAAPRPVPRRTAAPGRRPELRGDGDARAARVRPPAAAGRDPARRRLGRGHAGAPDVRPRRADPSARPRRSRRRVGGRARRRCSRSRRRSASACGSTSPSSRRASISACEHWGTAQGNAPELAKRLADLTDRGYRIVLSARGHGSLERVKEMVGDTRRRRSPTRSRRRSRTGSCSTAARLAVATEEDLFGSRRHTRSAPRLTKRRTDTIAEELEPGDYAVHRVHGVGRYAGIQRRQIAGAERDYMVVEYAQGDRLSVPTDQVGMLAKYLGGDQPRMSRLGHERLGARDEPREACREGHGRGARPAVLGADVGRWPIRVRPRHAVADGARGRLPARGDRRPAHRDRGGQGRHGNGRARWTA